MAGVAFDVTSGEVALLAATPKTVLQVKAAANQRVLITNLSMMGKAAAGGTDVPIKIRMTKSTASFGTGTAAVMGKNDPTDSETLQTTASANFTVEPTTPTDSGKWWEVQPQNGFIISLDFDKPIKVPGGQSVQFEATAAAAETLLITVTCTE